MLETNKQLGLVGLFNGISTFVDYLIPKSSLQKNSSDTISPIAGGKGGSYLLQVWKWM